MAEDKEVVEAEAELGKLKLDCNDNESVYLLGGYDGENWLSTLDLYSLTKDVITSSKPMHCVRSHASSVKLDDKIYAIGGGNGYQWYNSVESYDVAKDEWTDCPPIQTPKISLAACTLDNKIYALGGGNRFDWFTEVEMLDLGAGKWIPMEPMNDGRYCLAAVELNGAIYATGGFNGHHYLGTAERYDPREKSWTQLLEMVYERACHTMAVLNEKIYVISGLTGGSSGSSHYPYVEIYDPRKNSWLEGESVEFPRGFANAVVLNDSIYLMGGMDICERMIDKIECYKEGQGWKIIEPNAIGNRAFAASVLA